MQMQQRRCRLGCPGKILGSDVDDLFAYSTAKTVKIRDHRLGVLYYVFLVGIISYIGVYSLAYKLLYLQFHTPIGVARFTLQQPTLNTANNTPMCDPSLPWCKDNYPKKSSLSYCCREGCEDLGDSACHCSFRPQFKNYNCSFYDGESASQVERSQIFIVTRVKENHETENATCASYKADSCDKLWDVTSSSTAFVAGIENFTVLIDHAVQVPEIRFSRQARQVHGYLRVRGSTQAEKELCKRHGSMDSPIYGNPKNTPPCYIKPSQPDDSGLDIFEVSTLLTAAEVDLEKESFAGSGHSARYEGMTMLLNIVWENTQPWSGLLGEPSSYYYYDAYAMPKNAYSTHKSSWDPDNTRRNTLSMHGILVQASIMGQIGAFNFNTMLLQLTTSLTLLAVAGTLVNSLATYVMRYRNHYFKAITEVTADFDEIAELEAQSTEELREACHRCNLFTGGDRVDLINRLVMNGVQYPDDVVNSYRGPQRPDNERAVPLSMDGFQD